MCISSVINVTATVHTIIKTELQQCAHRQSETQHRKNETAQDQLEIETERKTEQQLLLYSTDKNKVHKCSEMCTGLNRS